MNPVPALILEGDHIWINSPCLQLWLNISLFFISSKAGGFWLHEGGVRHVTHQGKVNAYTPNKAVRLNKKDIGKNPPLRQPNMRNAQQSAVYILDIQTVFVEWINEWMQQRVEVMLFPPQPLWWQPPSLFTSQTLILHPFPITIAVQLFCFFLSNLREERRATMGIMSWWQLEDIERVWAELDLYTSSSQM